MEEDKIKYGESEIDNIWTAVCCNDLEFMKNYYSNGGKPNRELGHDISLIMLALKTNKYEMFEILKQNGEQLLKKELEEYKKIMVVYKYKDELTENTN